MKSIENKKSWLTSLKALSSVFGDVAPHKVWPNGALLDETLERICDNFESDMQALEKEALFMFSRQTESDENSQQAADILRKWQLTGAPSLSAMCVLQ